MNATWLAVLLGLLGGVAVGLQGPLSSLMSQRLGVLESVFVVHLGGALLAGLPLLLLGGGNLGAWRSVPPPALAAGALGVVLVATFSYAMPRLGVAAAVTLLVAAQLTIGTLLDHFGLLGAAVRTLDLSRLLGLAALFAGTWLIVRR